MQNIDFSRRIQHNAGMVSEGRNSATESVPGKNRCYFFAIALSFLFFSGGVYSGFQLHRVQHIEENLVRYPDTPEGESDSPEENGSSFSNIAEEKTRETAEGNYIILVGSYSPDKAARVAGELNGLPEVRSPGFGACRNMREDDPGRPPVFRTDSSRSGMQDVYAGCYSSESSGRRALDEIRRSSVPGAAEARLFTIR